MTLSAYVAKTLENRYDAASIPNIRIFGLLPPNNPAGTLPQRPRLNAQSQSLKGD
jgi:hypothetical protein